jgi:F0F1-type ATP synthase assembly protein I
MKPTGLGPPLREVYRYSGLGCTFAAAVVLFTLGGWLLDGWLGVTPLLSVTGALAGAALGTVGIYRSLLLKSGKGDRPRGDN